MMTGMSVCRDMGVEFCGSSFSYRPRVLSSNLGVGEFGVNGGDRLWRIFRRRSVIHQVLNDYYRLYSQSENPNLETMILNDEVQDQYLLLRMGVGWRSSDKSDCDSFAIVSSASSKDPVSMSFTKCHLSESPPSFRHFRLQLAIVFLSHTKHR